MDAIAYQAAKIFAWLLPLSLIVVGGIALAKGYRWAGASFLCSGLCGLAWDFLFMPVISTGIRPFFPEMVAYEDAPLGFVLANALPLISGLTLVGGCLSLLFRSNA